MRNSRKEFWLEGGVTVSSEGAVAGMADGKSFVPNSLNFYFEIKMTVEVGEIRNCGRHLKVVSVSCRHETAIVIFIL